MIQVEYEELVLVVTRRTPIVCSRMFHTLDVFGHFSTHLNEIMMFGIC